MEMLKKYMATEKYDFANQTLKQNLNHLTKEKILLDAGRGWYSTKDRLILINGSEYDCVFKNVIRSSRINISKLLRYSKRREVRDQLLDRIYQWQIMILSAIGIFYLYDIIEVFYKRLDRSSAGDLYAFQKIAII